MSNHPARLIKCLWEEKKTFKLENSSRRNSKCCKEHTGPISFFNSLCISVYNSHLGCNTEAETVYRSSLSETEKCNSSEVGSRVTEITSRSTQRKPLNLASPASQRSGARPWKHFCIDTCSPPQRTPWKDQGFLVVSAFPSFLSPSTSLLLDQLYKVG